MWSDFCLESSLDVILHLNVAQYSNLSNKKRIFQFDSLFGPPGSFLFDFFISACTKSAITFCSELCFEFLSFSRKLESLG